MTEEDTGITGESKQPEPPGDTLSSQRVFKKSSPNNKLTLYLSTRDLVVSAGKIDRLQGVLLVDPEFVEDRKVYGQITLTFRYGREDEEVMGLKFCNEAVMCLAQLYPICAPNMIEEITPLQEALIKRLGPNAYPFCMEITPLAPPSVQLVPAKEYNGAPIGTSYDIRAYVADKADEKLHRRTTVRMGIRVVQKAFAPPSPYGYNPGATNDSCGNKDRSSGKHKIALFGCKSAPLDSTKLFTAAPSMQVATKSKSVEGGLEIKVHKPQPTARPPTETTTADEVVSKTNTAQSAPHVEEQISAVESASRSPSPRPSINQQTQRDNARSPCKVSFEPPSDDYKPPEDGSRLSDQGNCKVHDERRDSHAISLQDIPAPHAVVEKYFLLSDGRVELEAALNKAVYHHGEEIQVTVHVLNNSNKNIRRIKVFVVQHVDVCMFSNGKFKNVVAMINSKEDCPFPSGKRLTRSYSLLPVKSSTKNWIALEDSYTKTGISLASTVTSCGNHPDERNVFAIYVSYYVKVKLIMSVMGGNVALKLPFSLMHTCNEYDPCGTLTRIIEQPTRTGGTKSATPTKSPEMGYTVGGGVEVHAEMTPMEPQDRQPDKDGT